MPILEIHLVENQFTDPQCSRLLTESSRAYADVLRCPIDRVRVFIDLHRPAMAAVAGVPVSQHEARAPYFRFLVLQGRPIEERQELLRRFTDIIVSELNVERELVRGGCWAVAPEDWAIGGIPASLRRAAEIEARASATQAPDDWSWSQQG